MATQITKSSDPLDIIVVGAGLGGLAAAIASRLAGHNVTVYESAQELKEVGAGLQVTPNASRILQTWGMPDTLWRSGAEPTCLYVHRYDGKILAQEDDFNVKMRRKYRAPFVDLHRVDLQLALVERATALGVQIRLGQRIDGIDLASTSISSAATGTSARGDLIIAGDGLWSKCRALYMSTNNNEDKDDPPVPTGDLAYRIVLDLDQIHDPELRAWVQNPTCHFWVGPGSHAVGYSLKGGNQYNIVLLVPDDLPEATSRQEGSVAEMMARFDGWDPVLTRFLGMVDSVEKWKLMHRKELPNWVSPQSNLVFVGDSCHPMLPYLAQGANSAIEDGAVLGLLLDNMTSRKQLPQALDMYQELRKARGEAIVRETFKQRDDFHLPDGDAQEARDRIFLSQLGKDEIVGPFPSRWTCPQIQSWLYGYDAAEEVTAVARKRPFVLEEGKQTSGELESILPSKASMASLRRAMSWLKGILKI